MHSLAKPYRIWKTVTVGGGSSEKQLIRELMYSGCEIEQSAVEFIRRSKFKVSPIRREVDFVLVAVMQLGLIRASFEVIMERAREFGFEPCSVEAALVLRLANCHNQRGDEETEMVSLAMNPIETTYQHRYSRKSVLCLAGGASSVTGKPELAIRHLTYGTKDENTFYDGQDDDLWAFVLPRTT